MHPESRTNRTFFQHRLAKLKAAVPGVELAAIATEDGLLSATDGDLEPSPVDRRAAVMASLAAVAQTAARELGHGELRSLRIGSDDGALLLRPFGRPRRRLLLLVLAADADVARAARAAQLLASDIELRLAPLADHHAADPADDAPAAAGA